MAQALAELSTLASGDAPLRVMVAGVGAESQPSVVVLGIYAVVGALVLIASGNAAGLLLASAESRRGEIALRMCLGARPARVARQFLTEALVITALAGVVAWPLALLLVPALAQLVQAPPGYNIEPSLSVYVVLVALTVLVGLASALLPVRQAFRTDPLSVLRATGDYPGSHGRLRSRRLILGLQAATSMTLLILSALLIRGAWTAVNLDLGIRAENLITIAPSGNVRTLGPLVGPLTEHPLVERLAHAEYAPFSGWDHTTVFHGTRAVTVSRNRVSAHYFATVGISVLQGRNFDEHERDVSRVAVVSAKLAESISPGASALGQILRMAPNEPGYEIIGVVSDAVTTNLRDFALSSIYFPMRSETESGAPLIIRTRVSALSALDAVHEVVTSVYGQSGVRLAVVSAEVHRQTGAASVPAALASLSGLIGLILATTGLYSMVALVVAQRSSEIGIRMAIGANRRIVATEILTYCLRPVLWGSLAGVGASLLGGTVLGRMLYGLNSYDPMAMGVATVVLLAAATLGALWPVSRVARIEPVQILRRL